MDENVLEFRTYRQVLRLEAEHLHNTEGTEGYRRVSVIPLHFDRCLLAVVVPARCCCACSLLLCLLAVVMTLHFDR